MARLIVEASGAAFLKDKYTFSQRLVSFNYIPLSSHSFNSSVRLPKMSKVALVVGGTGGLGAACAEELGKDHTVIISGRNKDKGDAIVSKIASAGGKAAFMAMDIKDEASIAVLHKTVLAKYGRLDLAVNAAGILPPIAKLADSTKDVYDNTIAINLTGVYLCMQEQIRAMRKNPDKAGGQVVNFSSVYGLTGCKWGSIYCRSSFVHNHALPETL